VFGYLKKLRQSRKGLIENLVWIIPYRLHNGNWINKLTTENMYEALSWLRQTSIAVKAFISTSHDELIPKKVLSLFFTS
jgi:hypothetical protein